MTEIVRVGRAEIDRLPGHRVAFTGTFAQVSAALVQLEERELLAAVPPVPQPTGVPGQVRAVAKLRPPVAADPPPAAPLWTLGRLAVAATVGVVIALAVVVAALIFIGSHLGLLLGVGAIVAFFLYAGRRHVVDVLVRVRVR